MKQMIHQKLEQENLQSKEDKKVPQVRKAEL